MFGDAGCGVGWSVSVTPTCLSRLIFGLLTNINGKVYVMQCNRFPVCKRLVFVFTLTNGMEWGGKVEWKKRNVWRPGVFSLFSGMFHLVKAREWEGTCVLCWSEWFGDFSRGCVLTKRVWVRMNLRCVRVFEGELRLFEELEAEFFSTHEWKRWRLSHVCVWASQLIFCLIELQRAISFVVRVWSLTHACMLIQKHTPGGRMNGRTDYHTGLLLMTSLLGIWSLHPFHVQRPIQSASAAPWLFHRCDDYCLFFRDYSL